ncbi:NAD(P)/FAD-dependent oxidoreductase [Mesorhizobium australicum]|uniref:D-amino-acid dehydrogenase n=1 Tax=Mesorhizobium australicum TaxID=536018 RepID=A0A1X7PZP6_9HYPH|nr:FAD-binding oxidoreductase [Mesorhizobium australicum]SMH57003.1 D-amino-acid dehydrogenase [Mesorhizobium australicum]
MPTAQPADPDADIVVIGAGIVGICAAAFLAEAGKRVLVVDRTGICEETSSGNAAALAFAEILPLAHKGMMKKLPRWLSDPLGPLSISPAYLPRLTPWLWRFWRAGQSDPTPAIAAQASLMRLAEAEWMGLFDRSGTRAMLREDGSLDLYESEREFQESLPGWAAREVHGIALRHVEGKALAELQPGLSPRFVKGTFVPGWKTVDDPKLLGKAIWAYAESKGARFVRGVVATVGAEGDAARIKLTDGRVLAGRHLIIAAGAWSHMLASRFGDTIPLETERGYNTTLPVGAFDLKRQLFFAGHGFVITPLSTGVRVGGAVEFAGLQRAPNYARSKAMLTKAATFLPGLKTEGGREWMGYRPSLPDSLPVMGKSRSAPNVFYAFGHGHLGLTQAAATGRLMRDLVTGDAPAIDLAPFSPQRF